MNGNGGFIAAYFMLLFCLILRAGFAVLHHCKPIAERLGEPYGTLLGTFTSNVIEVASIAAVILHRSNNPTLLRDSLVSTIMIVLNCVLGMTLLVGAWRRKELSYNLRAANNYISVLVPLSVLTLILPGFVDSESGAMLDHRQTTFLSIMTVTLYAAFIALQIGQHRTFFVQSSQDLPQPREFSGLRPHLILLTGNALVAIMLAIRAAQPFDFFLEDLQVNPLLGGVVVALLGSIPEAAEAMLAARADRLQHAVNILFGSALATISITVPAILVIAAIAGRSVQLAVQGTDSLMLTLTLAMCVITFTSGRTTALQGAVHLLLFCAYLLLVAAP